jgi:hypothetical protein
MTAVDLTVAVTAHSETLVAGPTMRSAEAAIRNAEAAGLRVERLIGLDAPSADCRTFFSQPAFAAWKISEFELCDQGAARNALAKIAAGRWIAFLDADDLFSENWLVRAAERLAQAAEAGDKVIVHPEINWIFDTAQFVFAKPAQDDPIFTPYYFYITTYYDALCMAPRESHIKTPYAPRDIAAGFAYEDWQWNVETMAAGWRHVIAKDTIVFKRLRDTSQGVQSRQRQTLIRDIEPMAIDRIMDLGRGFDVLKSLHTTSVST